MGDVAAPTVAPAPATTVAPPPMCVDPAESTSTEPTYYGDGGGSPEDQAAAFSHYADDPIASVPPAPATTAPASAPATAPKAGEPETVEQRDARLKAAVTDLKKSPEQFAEADRKAKEVAARLATEMTKPHLFGKNTEVTDCLQGLSPAEVQLVKDHYAAQYKSLGKDGKDLESDLKEKLDGKDLAVADAVMSGDKVKAATAFVDQAADGVGTDLDTWKKALSNLDAKERAQFEQDMDKKLGKAGAYQEMLREETSSHDRDELTAMSIADEDERAASLAQVAVSRNSFGGQFTTLNEGLQDTVGDLVGESADSRRDRRLWYRENDPLTGFSNAGGGEDQTLDAVEGLKNKKQADLFKQKMLKENGETAETTFDGELSDSHNKAARAFADGDYNEGIAQRMVADARNIVDDREDGMSKGFETVRLSPAKEEEIAAISDPKERAAKLAAAQSEARTNLRHRTNKIAEDAGFGGYDELLADELSPEQLAAAKDRMSTGRVSDVNQLLAAGEGVGGTAIGKDSETFYKVMQNKTPKDMEKLEAEFDAKEGKGAFKAFLEKKATSKGEARDFEIMREGNYAAMSPEEQAKFAAEHPEKMIKRVKDLHDAAKAGVDVKWYDPMSLEQAAGNEIGNAIADNHGDIGERTDGRRDAVDEMQKKLDAGQPLTPSEQAELQDHVRYMQGDQKQYTATKTEAARTVAEGAGTVAEVTTIAVTGNKDAAALVGSAVEIGVEQRLDPARMSQDRVLQKSVEAVGNYAVAAAGGAAFPDEVVKASPHMGVVKDVMEGAGEGVVKAVSDPKNLTDAGKLVEAAGNQAADGATAAAASNAAGGRIPETTMGGRAVKQVAESAAEQVSTGDLSRQGGDILKDIGKDAAKGIAKGEAGEHHEKQKRVAATPDPLDNLDPDRPVTPPDFDQMHEDIQTRPNPQPGERLDVDSVITPTPDPAYGPPRIPTESDDNVDGEGTVLTPNAAPSAGESKPSVFGEETIERGKRQLTTPDGTSARLVGDQLVLKFTGTPSPAEREAIAKDAMDRMGVVAPPGAKLVVDESGIARIDRQLVAPTGEQATEAAQRLFMTEEAKNARKDDTQESLDAKCEKLTLRWQQGLAEEGMYARAVVSKPGVGNHKFLIVGDRIMDPSIGQFLGGGGANENGEREPFMGTYQDLVQRLDEAKAAGRLPAETNVKDLIERQWGLQESQPGEPLQRSDHLEDIKHKGIEPTNVPTPTAPDEREP